VAEYGNVRVHRLANKTVACIEKAVKEDDFI